MPQTNQKYESMVTAKSSNNEVSNDLVESARDVNVSIVMPCLNEQETIHDCIADAQQLLKQLKTEYGLTGEIIIGDNGSIDGSIEIAEKLGVKVIHVTERGYGNALRGAILHALGEFIIMADSDGSYSFQDALPMIDQLQKGHDLCMGNRFQGKIMPGAMPWKNRYIGNPLLTGILNLLFNSGIHDAHCGIRAFRSSSYKKMRLTSSGMEFASEMVIKSALMGLKCTEVPITLYPDGRDRPPHLRPWRDGWRHLRYIFLLSPSWLFFIPSFVMFAIGAIVFGLLLINSEQSMITIGSMSFGDHWLIISGALLVSSHFTLIMGFATTLYGVHEGYRRLGKRFSFLLQYINLESVLLLGTIVFIVGIFVIGSIFLNWSSAGFGSLDKIREIYAGSITALIGLQTFFGGLLIAIISGNRSQFHHDFMDESNAC